MDTLGQFVLFCIVMFTTYTAIRISNLGFRYWVARRIIALQLENAVMSNEQISPRDKIVYNQETEEIVEQVVIQLCQGLKYQRKWIITHAMRHMAILYQTNIWLTNTPDDVKVHEALDVIKQKFYYMHGTFINISRSKVRNHISMELLTTSGDTLASIGDLTQYDKKKHGEGCRLRVVISLVTPLTPRNYDYFKYI